MVGGVAAGAATRIVGQEPAAERSGAGLREAADLFPRVMKELDEPFADASVVPTYRLSQLASGSVKVVLGGDGGDELFAVGGSPGADGLEVCAGLGFVQPMGCLGFRRDIQYPDAGSVLRRRRAISPLSRAERGSVRWRASSRICHQATSRRSPSWLRQRPSATRDRRSDRTRCRAGGGEGLGHLASSRFGGQSSEVREPEPLPPVAADGLPESSLPVRTVPRRQSLWSSET